MPDKRYEEEAERRVMEDLLNALLAEELLVGLQVLTPQEVRAAIGEADPAFAAAWKLLDGASAIAPGDEQGLARPEAGQGAISAPGELIGLWRPHGEAAVVFGLRRSPWQRLRCMPAARVAAGRADGAAELLAPAAWMRLVAEHRAEASGTRPADAADVAAATGMARAAGMMAGAAGAAVPAGTAAPAGTAGAAEAGAEAFIDMLRQTAEQIAWSLERRAPVKDLLALPQDRSLLALERCAALRDRPFHPVAKVKLGWGRAECGLYTAEAGQPIRLRWMAVRRDRLLSGGAGEALPQSLLLPADARAPLEQELRRRGLDGTHIALPVHPWQLEQVLPQRLQPELASGVCVPLDTAAGTFYATSSVRSLMSLGESSQHVKLPLGIRSLGGQRYLSAIKLMNGVRAESLLQQARALDPVLGEKLHLCEEGSWWALAPQDNDLFAENPRHLSAMIRRYPRALAPADDSLRLVPMSALAAHEAEAGLLPQWLRLRGLPNTAQGALKLFREIAVLFSELLLRLLRFGLVPEAHGQNAVLVLKEGQVHGLLLRDHDALRVHVPWLRKAGLEDPGYMLRPGVPNSLYHDTPQQLLAFFQMLGIQVNLFAIMDSVSRDYGLAERSMWAALEAALLTALAQAGLPSDQEEIVRASLFMNEHWPWKQIVRPLLAQSAKVPGSMPYSKGETSNPFLAAKLQAADSQSPQPVSRRSTPLQEVPYGAN
ncbi:hypothetical protein GNP94_13015 [Paenibacillus campinasensis]|uniref:IucA/IucC family siderophore biosynthesis protein n=1 Tax=Paenibacillus campinasensis TaxID=66347 RepID=A0ABW9T0V9_9BACL|nr:IucA/IucC family protein [Paenibacillus campinasensis]MUG66925.1 hypothetical protein [Paenibacillus campinasensis]